MLEGHSVVCVRKDEARISDERGIRPLLEMIGRGESLCGFCVADKIVGKAAALLFSILQPEALYARVLSEGGATVLEKFKIPYSCGTSRKRSLTVRARIFARWKRRFSTSTTRRRLLLRCARRPLGCARRRTTAKYRKRTAHSAVPY